MNSQEGKWSRSSGSEAHRSPSGRSICTRPNVSSNATTGGKIRKKWIRGSPLTQWSLHLFKTQCHSDGRWCDLQKLDDPLSLPKNNKGSNTKKWCWLDFGSITIITAEGLLQKYWRPGNAFSAILLNHFFCRSADHFGRLTIKNIPSVRNCPHITILVGHGLMVLFLRWVICIPDICQERRERRECKILVGGSKVNKITFLCTLP